MTSIRLKIMMALGAIALVAGGFADLGNSMKYRSAIPMAYASFVAQHPQDGWYAVSGGYLDASAAILPSDISERAYYVPYIQTGSQTGSKLQVLAYVTDPATVDQIDSVNNHGNRPMTAYGMTHESELPQAASDQIPISLSGMVVQSSPGGSSDDVKIEELLKPAGQYTLIIKDRHPNALMGLLYLGAGLLLAIGFLWSVGLAPENLLPTKPHSDRSDLPYNGIAGRQPIPPPGPSYPSGYDPHNPFARPPVADDQPDPHNPFARRPSADPQQDPHNPFAKRNSHDGNNS
jgi:hypothetical protein